MLKSKSARGHNIDRLISIPSSQYRLLHLIYGHRITATALLIKHPTKERGREKALNFLAVSKTKTDCQASQHKSLNRAGITL